MALKKLKDLAIGFKAGSGAFREKRPTLVMIHGAGGSAQIWQSQVHLLKASLNTLALDLPGHGKTSGQSKTLVNDYAHWLAETISALFQEPVFLMGHSLGGAIAQETAVLHPKLLRGIILVSTGLRLQVAPMFLDGLLNRFENTVDTIMNLAYAPNADPSLIREGAKLMKQNGSKVAYGDFLACDQFDRRGELEALDLPCLIVCGEKDILTPPALSEALHKSIRKSMLKILPSAGHMVMIEEYKVFNQYVRDFTKAIQQ